MSVARAAIQKTELLSALRTTNFKNVTKCRKNLTGLRHYATARPLNTDGGGMSNLQMVMITGGVSYFAAHAIYVGWSDRLSSQKNHPASSEEHKKEADVTEDVAAIEKVSHESLSEEVASKPEEDPPESFSEEIASKPKEVESTPKVTDESVAQPEETSNLPESHTPEAINTSEPAIVPQENIDKSETVKDVLISSDASVNIVMGAPVPRSVGGHPPPTSDSGPKDIIITQSK